MRHKKQIKTGGGYDSDMTIESPTERITLRDLGIPPRDESVARNITFVVTNKTTNPTSVKYNYVKYVGQGTYGVVYLVNGQSESDGQQKQFVIKIQGRHKSIREEALKMDTIMLGINPECAYVAVSQGMTDNIEHAVFPYVGSKNLLQYVVDTVDTPIIALFPKIIADVIECLTAINLKGFSHLDLKLENVVINEFGKSTIIDYGLAVLHTSIIRETIGNPSVVNAGNPQLSVEMLLGRIRQKDDNFGKGDELITKIKQTIDNFGLFWLILDILTLDGSYNGVFIYFTTPNDPKGKGLTVRILMNFYNMLTTSVEFQETVIAKVKTLIITENFNIWFGVGIGAEIEETRNLRFNEFMKRVFLLVHYNPERRIYAKELLSDPFFSGGLSGRVGVGGGGGYSYKRPPRKRTRRSRLGRGRGRWRRRTVSGLKK